MPTCTLCWVPSQLTEMCRMVQVLTVWIAYIVSYNSCLQSQTNKQHLITYSFPKWQQLNHQNHLNVSYGGELQSQYCFYDLKNDTYTHSIWYKTLCNVNALEFINHIRLWLTLHCIRTSTIYIVVARLNKGAQWLSGRVLDTRLGPLVRASSASLCCVLEQDTLFLFSTVSTQEDPSRHNSTIVDWDIKNQYSKNPFKLTCSNLLL